MSEKIQAQPDAEGQPVSPATDTETDNSADSPTVDEKETDIDPTPSSEEDKDTDGDKKDDDTDEPTDLHSNPRWKERENDWKERFNDQEKRHLDAVEKLREEFGSKITESKGDETPSVVPSWFGGDEQQWKEFQSWNQGLHTKTQENIQKGITEKSEAEQKQIDDATKYLNSELSTIESDKELNPDKLKIDRNKLLKFVMDNELVDTQGRWNYKAGWQMMRAGLTQVKNKSIEEKKKLAGATTSDKGSEEGSKDFSTSETFDNPGNRPW